MDVERGNTPHGTTPWLPEQPLESGLSPYDKDSIKSTSRVNRWILSRLPPSVSLHLVTFSRRLNTTFCWILLFLLIFLSAQAILIQKSTERNVKAYPVAVDSAFEDDFADAFNQWQLLQEQYPNTFSNFSQYLVESKNKESYLRKKLMQMNDHAKQLLMDVVVPPAGKPPTYDSDESEELKVNYLMDEKLWPYVGNERYLERTKRGSIHYYNSLATFGHSNRTRMHGIVGLHPNGTRAWVPNERPPPIDEYPGGREEALKDSGFYVKLSDAISLDREVPDYREEFCRAVEYDLDKMEDASIIITFYNEKVSTLLRTVHSLLNYTPPPLLREIILVDDHSNSEGITSGGFLDYYIQLLPKVKLYRLPERRGLVQARLAGAKIARAPVFVVLDSHIEVNKGWLEPQLARLYESPKSVVFPEILGIIPETMEHTYHSGITCYLSFKWMMQERAYFDHPKSPEPVPSPSMAGGLFAVRRDRFFDLGGYDEEFSMWGAENVEMGFRHWLCGGRVECTPCSKTYHIYRKGGSGYSSPGDFISKNRFRTAAAWTDEYFQLAQHFIDKPTQVDIGTFQKVKELKQKYKCKPFQWYLDNVDVRRGTFDMTTYGLLGAIKSPKDNFCLDTLGKKDADESVGFYPCHGGKGSQGWIEDRAHHQLRPMIRENMCISKENKFTYCNVPDLDSRWRVIPEKKWIAFAKSNQALLGNTWNEYQCLEKHDNDKFIWVECTDDNEKIRWEFEIFKADPDYKNPYV